MNPRIYIFVLILFLMASLQVEAAYSAGGEAAGQNSGEAQNNVIEVVTENSGTKVIIGQTTEGIKIRITTYPQYKNNIYTAYPYYD